MCITLVEGVFGMPRREAVAERTSSSRVKFFVIFIFLLIVVEDPLLSPCKGEDTIRRKVSLSGRFSGSFSLCKVTKKS